MRIMWLMEKINSQGLSGLGCKKDLLIAEFCEFFGASSRTAPDYLKELEIQDKIVILAGSVYSRKFFTKNGNAILLNIPHETPEQEAQRAMDNILGKEDASHDKILEDIKI